MLLPSRKTQLLAYSFRSQYRLGWNLALPEEDRSNHRQTDGPILAPFCVRAIFGRASAPAEPQNSAARSFVPLAIPAQMELHAPGPGPFLPAKNGWPHFVARFVVLKNLAQRTAH